MTVFTGLDKLRVVNLSEGIAGAYCCHLLVDAGADVVKVERAEGDPLRNWIDGGPKPVGTCDDEDGALFRFLHHGVRSVVGAHTDGETRDLLQQAHLIVESGQLRDADIALLRQSRQDLVIVSVTPFGRMGPYAQRPSSEFTIQAESGTLLYRGSPREMPFQHGGRVTDWISGTYAAVVGVASVRGAERTGLGDHLDLSMLEVMAIAGSGCLEYAHQIMGNPPLDGPWRKQETPSIEPTADGYVGFCTNTRDQFNSFLILIERPDLLEDEDLASMKVRSARFDEWNAIVHEWTRRKTTHEVVKAASELRIPVAPVNSAEGVASFEQFLERGALISDPTGTFVVPRRPWQMSGHPPAAPRPSPRLGEHTSKIGWTNRDAVVDPGEGNPLPLSGLRILDMTAWWAGPMATSVLASLGADVLHVESITRLDGMRTTGTSATGTAGNWWERSPQFICRNSNKRGVTVDLASSRGRELFEKMIKSHDVLIENFSPRVLGNLGLGWSEIHKLNPRLILVRMPAFGLDGPWRDNVGFAQTMEQVTGLAWRTGHVDDQPRIQSGPSDPNAGMHAAFALLVALAQRDRSGEGSQVEATMVEAALNAGAEAIVEWSAYGNRLDRMGNRAPHVVPQGLYACKGDDAWLAISVETDPQWEALAKVLGHPQWEGLTKPLARNEREGWTREIDLVITEWAAERDAYEAAEELTRIGVPAAPARDPRLMLEHPQLRARHFHELTNHPVVGQLFTPSMPFRSSNVAHWLRRPAPTLGQHNHEVYVGELGVSEPDYAALIADRIIGALPAGI